MLWNSVVKFFQDFCDLETEQPSESDQKEKNAFRNAEKHSDICSSIDLSSRECSYLSLMMCDFLFDAKKRNRIAVVIYFLMIWGWAYPVYFSMVTMLGWDGHPGFHTTFILTNVTMWFFYLRTALSNPGQLPRYTEQYNQVMKKIIDRDRRADSPAMGTLCHMCQLLRPLRAEHCGVTNRCVAAFDRYCPLVSNTLGYNNRGLFFVFLVLLAWNCWVMSFIGVVWLRKFGFQPLSFITVVFLILIAAVMSLRAFYTSLLAMANLTTFEIKNYKELRYLRVTAGCFTNPFHRQVKVNLLEYFHFVQPLTESEIKARLQQNQV